MTRTDAYEGLLAETVTVVGDGGDEIHAYFARPLGRGPFGAVVLFHHLPGWDAWYRATTRRFAEYGYLALSPDLYCRDGHGEPDDVAARVRAEGGVPDDRVVADARGCVDWLRSLPQASGRLALFGTCSGGRHAFLCACRIGDIDAVVDCWGGRIVVGDDDLTAKQPVAPIDYTADLDAPLLGLFGNDDKSPAPADVDTLEAALKQHGKDYAFHRYDGAGHGFFYDDRPAAYRAEAAVDGWRKVRAFLTENIG
ncbi:MAG: dienelactone hydrolase family protein [Nitriliruptoraceae bacterium]